MLYRMPGRPWFRHLSKGLPVQPLTWEGWAFTGCYVAGLAAFAHAARVLPPYREPPLVAPFVISVLLLSAFFMVFCWLKSEALENPLPGAKVEVNIVKPKDDKTPKPPSRWI
jgi:hypothetical protein